MPNFRYTASDRRGVWRTGEVEGPTRDEVAAGLVAEGLEVDSLVEAEPEPARDVRPEAGVTLTRVEVAELVEQLEGLTRSGLPLPSGLRAAGLELASPRLRAVFGDLAARVEAGEGLDRALGSGSIAYPAHVRGLILAGGRSGRLAETLGEYVRTANLGAELRRRFWRVVSYPLFVQVAMVALTLLICHMAILLLDDIDGDLTIYRGFWGNNPPRARTGGTALMTVARFIDRRGLGLVILGSILLPLAWATARWAAGPARVRRWVGSIPVFGSLLRYTALAEFCHLSGMLLEAEVPLPEALRLAGDAVRDPDLAETCGRMARLVDSGLPLSEALAAWPAIPAGLGQLLGWSERSETLPAALRAAGAMFEARARSQANFSGNVAATLLTLLILWWVGFALAVIYVPLFQAIRYMAG